MLAMALAGLYSEAPVDVAGAVALCVGIRCGAISSDMKLSCQAARSIGWSMVLVASVCQPSTLRMLIWPEASSAQNNMAAVSAEGSTVWVLIRRLNSSCNRSIAFVVQTVARGRQAPDQDPDG